MRKLMLLVAFALGYVLGTRAGRERYDQIMGTVDKVRQDPRVQEKTQQAVDAAKQQAPVVADKVTSAASTAASAAASKVTGSHESHGNGQPSRMSWALQDLP
jgi:hypothetical protein